MHRQLTFQIFFCKNVCNRLFSVSSEQKYVTYYIQAQHIQDPVWFVLTQKNGFDYIQDLLWSGLRQINRIISKMFCQNCPLFT